MILLELLSAGVVDATGEALDSGRVYVYRVGTTTAATIYSDPALTQPTSNPVTLDSAGKAEIYVDEEVRLVIEDAEGNQVDDIASLGTVTATTAASDAGTAELAWYERIATHGKPRYKAASAGTTVTVPGSAAAPACVIINGNVYANVSNETCDLSTAGRGGLDTGAIAANTPYYLYAVPNIAGDGFDLVASVTAPTTGPTGFTAWTYIGSFCTELNSAAIEPFQASGGVLLHDDDIEYTAHTGDTTTTAKTYASMPTTVTAAYGFTSHNGAGAVESSLAVSGTSAGGDNILVRSQVLNVSNYSYGWVPVFTAQTLWLTLSDAATLGRFYLCGWREDPGAYK